MSPWIFDVDLAPRNAPVILATKCGKVIRSRWLPPDDKQRRPVGRWEGLSAKGDDPVAWMHWPEHPGALNG